MSATTRVNGSFGNYTTGTLFSVYQMKAFVIDAGGDLQGQDADAAGEVDQAVEAVIREVQPLMYFTPSAGDGIIHVIVDGHAIDATTLQARIRAMGTVNSYDLSGATVTLGTAIVVS
jgi:hypothetical protein